MPTRTLSHRIHNKTIHSHTHTLIWKTNTQHSCGWDTIGTLQQTVKKNERKTDQIGKQPKRLSHNQLGPLTAQNFHLKPQILTASLHNKTQLENENQT